ncbi:hypothetical protein PUNSTDRAFT_44623 [Punctularia strigosozonata HHB-11173 SS5]|uniref:uncharacterized protein n=1 Tax=Punctularia strigosozonata (strain HHB-11173) TaxID=741275 RepID=UPI000441673B|nr:uncharacterized protein PUNSTDRAFT_44623 [Punctularia strigosozonata HHB-11173 SS5]EIN09224.1 hypothetical protein PUNSTDRAFT_44623 [Punctularia strigosozonata HHB-11173 SS5]
MVTEDYCCPGSEVLILGLFACSYARSLDLPAQISIDEAELAGFIGESILYGCAMTLMLATMALLVSPKRKLEYGANARMRHALLAMTSLFILLSTAHWIIDLSRIWTTFIMYRHQSDGSTLFLAEIWNPRNVAKQAVVITEAVLMDIILVRPGEDVFASLTGRWIVSALVLGLSTNIMQAALITYRIVKRDRDMRGFTTAELSPMIPVAIESAVILGVLNLVTLLAFAARSNVQFSSATMVFKFIPYIQRNLLITRIQLSPMIGIAYGLIMVRIGLSATGLQAPTIFHSRVSRPPAECLYPMEVRITQETDMETRAAHKSESAASWIDGDKNKGIDGV